MDVSAGSQRLARRISRLIGAVSSLLLVLAVLPAHARAQDDKDAAALTNQLVQTVGQYRRVGAAMKHSMDPQLATLVVKREAALLAEMHQDPGAFLRHTLSPAVGAQLPTGLQAHLEEEVNVEGEMTVLWAEDFSRHAELLQQLKVAGTPAAYTLHFADESPQLRSGTKVKVHGVQLGSHLAIAQSGGSSVQTTTTSTVAASLVSGVQPTLVIAVSFQDRDLTCSTSGINALMFGSTNSVSACYHETSFNQVDISGVVVGPYTIPYASSACDYSNWATAAENAARAAGVDPAAYPHRIYVLPTNGCPYAGLGTVGGNPSQAWILGYCGTADVYGHEFGHNLGMNHASTPTGEYDDLSDIMGYSGVGLRQVNEAHKVQMGWVPPARTQAVTSSGTYAISFLETASTQIQTLKIAKPDTSEFYYVGYRLPIGYDTILSSNYANRINIHRQSSGGNTYFLSSLSDGTSFQDAVNGITVTQVSHDTSGGAVSVSMTAAPCLRNAPIVSLTPLNQVGSQGQTLKYAISITNNDASTCSATTFTLGSLLPSGWTGSATPATLSLSPGAGGSSTWSVASAPTTIDGSYQVTANIVDSGDTTRGTSVNATYVVFADITPPVVSLLSPLNGSTVSGRVTITASASDDVRVTKVDIWIDGALKATDTSAPYTLSWQTKRAARGQHRIEAKAFDGAGHVASASILVTVVR